MGKYNNFDELPEEIKYLYCIMRNNHPEQSDDEVKEELVATINRAVESDDAKS